MSSPRSLRWWHNNDRSRRGHPIQDLLRLQSHHCLLSWIKRRRRSNCLRELDLLLLCLHCFRRSRKIGMPRGCPCKCILLYLLMNMRLRQGRLYLEVLLCSTPLMSTGLLTYPSLKQVIHHMTLRQDLAMLRVSLEDGCGHRDFLRRRKSYTFSQWRGTAQ